VARLTSAGEETITLSHLGTLVLHRGFKVGVERTLILTTEKIFEESIVKALLVAALCTWCSVGFAQPKDMSSGILFLPICKGFIEDKRGSAIEYFQQGECLGVVRTLRRLGRQLTPPFRNCTPSETPNVQVLSVVVVYMENRPQRLHEPFIGLAGEAIAKAWPCNQ
jgi:hypothetical protein